MFKTPSNVHPTDPTYGWTYRRTIRLKRHQKVRDVIAGRGTRIEIKPPFYDTTAWFTSKSRYYTFLSPQGRLQCVRRDRVAEENLLDDPVYIHRGRRVKIPEIRDAVRQQVYWNQPRWFTVWLQKVISHPELKEKMLKCRHTARQSARRLKYFRREAWKKYFRKLVLHRQQGLPPPPKPKCPYPEWKRRTHYFHREVVEMDDTRDREENNL